MVSGAIHDEAYQRSYLEKLCAVIMVMLDKTDDIPSYISSSPDFPAELKVKDLI